MSMMFKFPVIELVDRYCIAKLKFNKLGNNKAELDFYRKQVKNLDLKKIENQLQSLYEVHEKVWELEDDFKKHKVDTLYDLEEIGRRALTIRNIMEERYILKNKIAELLNDSIRETKNYGDIFKI